MTGYNWIKIMTICENDKKFKGVDKILSNDNYKLMDMNKIPLASIKTSFNLDPKYPPQQLETDPKTFLFVVENVPLFVSNEEI